MIARFYFSDGSTREIGHSQSARGIVKQINGELQRPIRVEFIDGVAELQLERWKQYCESAVATTSATKIRDPYRRSKFDEKRIGRIAEDEICDWSPTRFTAIANLKLESDGAA